MRAYKFRGAGQIEFALDIMLKRRLFCADWTQLNDPVEGIYSLSYSTASEEFTRRFMNEVAQAKKPLRVCALSRTYDNHLLWAHYADGFRGLAIEVELPEAHPDVVDVEYRGVFAHLTEEQALSPAEAARVVLSSKYDAWSYEEEVRILSEQTFFQLTAPVSRIIVGHRMNDALFDGLRIICESEGIEVNRTGIGDEGIDADSVPRMGEPW